MNGSPVSIDAFYNGVDVCLKCRAIQAMSVLIEHVQKIIIEGQSIDDTY